LAKRRIAEDGVNMNLKKALLTEKASYVYYCQIRQSMAQSGLANMARFTNGTIMNFPIGLSRPLGMQEDN